MSRHPQDDYSIEILFDWTKEQILIPLDWTPQQAEAAVSILENLEERILTLYGDDIIEMIKSRHFIDVCFTDDTDENDTHLIEDDIPF